VRYDASFLEVARVYDALVLRADPGQLQAAGALERFDADVEALGRRGALVWPSPAARRCLGSKEALARIAHLPFGDAKTVAYRTAEEMSGAAFPGVFKQARGSGGQGVWIAMRASGLEGPADPDEVLVLREAADNHVETCVEIKFVNGAFNLNRRVDLYAIDATPVPHRSRRTRCANSPRFAPTARAAPRAPGRRRAATSGPAPSCAWTTCRARARASSAS
jgi:hypothetical protein